MDSPKAPPTLSQDPQGRPGALPRTLNAALAAGPPRPASQGQTDGGQFAITAIRQGGSPTFRHLMRSQRIALRFLHDMLCPDSEDELDLHEMEGQLSVEKADTDDHKGDVLTKELPRAAFETKLRNLGMAPTTAMAALPSVDSSLSTRRSSEWEALD